MVVFVCVVVVFVVVVIGVTVVPVKPTGVVSGGYKRKMNFT